MNAGGRVVLLLPRAGSQESKKLLVAALEQLAQRGWVPVSIVDPADHRKALQMILDDVADVIVPVRPEYLPSVWFAGNLTPGTRAQPVQRSQARMPSAVMRASQPVRTERSPRPDVVGAVRGRRTQLIPRPA